MSPVTRSRARRLTAVLALAAAVAATDAAGSPPSEEQPPPAYTVQADVEYGRDGAQRLLLDAYLPVGVEGPRPVVLLLHGGTWRGGDRKVMGPYAAAAAERGFVALAVGYRVNAPSAFPTELNDAQQAVRWARADVGGYGIDPRRIGVLGSSAGGHLAALLATVGSGPLTEAARVRAAVSWSGPMDLAALTEPDPAYPEECQPDRCIDAERWRAILTHVVGCPIAACPARYGALSPIRLVSPDDAPTMLVNARDELAVPRAQAEGMAAALQAAGVAHRLMLVPGDAHADGYGASAIGPSLDFLGRYI
jgi:acetyl esterase/lipase